MFNAKAATLMDFSIEQADGVTFAYVLPYSENHALIEFTGFCAEDYPIEFFEES